MTSPQSWRPISPASLAEAVAEWLAETPGILRVAIDGMACAKPDALAEQVKQRLRVLGRPVGHVQAATFWRDMSLRYEYGRADVEAFRTTWLDAAALRREVLDPIVRRRRYLPSLRDPVTNRSTHEPLRPADPDTVLLVSGELLLGRELPFDRIVHLWLSPSARDRQAGAELGWTLPAFEQYEREVDPVLCADVVIKLDDPLHPAVNGLPE